MARSTFCVFVAGGRARRGGHSGGRACVRRGG